MANIKQIAKNMAISVATVSNTLTGKGRVSSEMVERVRTRTNLLGYRPSLPGRALRREQTGTLGLVMHDLTNPLLPRIAQNLSLLADQRQSGILIGDSRGNPDEQTQATERIRVTQTKDPELATDRRGHRSRGFSFSKTISSQLGMHQQIGRYISPFYLFSVKIGSNFYDRKIPETGIKIGLFPLMASYLQHSIMPPVRGPK